MKDILLMLKKIDKQAIERLSMSAISGFLVSLFLVFTRDIGTLSKGNFFLGFALIFLLVLIISYYINIKTFKKIF